MHLKLVRTVIILKKKHVSICNAENFHKCVKVRKWENSFCSQI